MLSKQISQFIREHYEEFLSFDDVKIYYDNGQVEVSKILSSVFNALLPNPVFRKVMPTDYKLFQVADLLCTLKLVILKMENNMFSKSEMMFFGNLRDLKKNYLKPLQKKYILKVYNLFHINREPYRICLIILSSCNANLNYNLAFLRTLLHGYFAVFIDAHLLPKLFIAG